MKKHEVRGARQTLADFRVAQVVVAQCLRTLVGRGLIAVSLVSCGGGSGDPPPASTLPPQATPPTTGSTAFVRVDVAVRAGMNVTPFDVPRMLTVPEGTRVALHARIPNARFMAVAPSGDLLVSDTADGRILLLREDGGGNVQTSTFAAGLTAPHDLVFHRVGGTTYLYIAQSNRIVRAVYITGDTAVGPLETIIDNLPDDSTPGLQGSYAHRLKNIALRDDKLYVSIASSCNANCPGDLTASPMRGAIHEYDLEGGNRRLFAEGVRNAEGLAFRPGTAELWVTVNGRDNIAYPLNNDWDGDGVNDYGRVIQSYVDSHPADMLTQVRDGGHYGWPFCNPNTDGGTDNPPYDRDVQNNADGSALDCAAIDRPTKGLPPHSAPLGMSFLANAGLPSAFDNGIAVAFHGCWNCTELNGHKIAIFPLRTDGSVGAPIDLVSGWVTNAANRNRWGRPVDVIPDGRGGLYVSDDFADAVYRVTFSGS